MFLLLHIFRLPKKCCIDEKRYICHTTFADAVLYVNKIEYKDCVVYWTLYSLHSARDRQLIKKKNISILFPHIEFRRCTHSEPAQPTHHTESTQTIRFILVVNFVLITRVYSLRLQKVSIAKKLQRRTSSILIFHANFFFSHCVH